MRIAYRGQSGEQRREKRRGGQPRQGAYRDDSSTCTRNSVPRTPMMADGVRIFIDSGDCFTILPETAARRPWRRLPSNSLKMMSEHSKTVMAVSPPLVSD